MCGPITRWYDSRPRELPADLNVVAAARMTAARDHPCRWILAENAESVHVAGHRSFTGPMADVAEQMGDKVRAKEAMCQAGAPALAPMVRSPEALRRRLQLSASVLLGIAERREGALRPR
jgi:biotin carboxylase